MHGGLRRNGESLEVFQQGSNLDKATMEQRGWGQPGGKEAVGTNQERGGDTLAWAGVKGWRRA